MRSPSRSDISASVLAYPRDDEGPPIRDISSEGVEEQLVYQCIELIDTESLLTVSPDLVNPYPLRLDTSLRH